MEREEMIKDISKKVCIACGKCKELKGDCYFARNIACVLIGANYRKIPESAVVLTKEEYEKLKAGKINEQGNVYVLERRIDDLKRNFQLLHQELKQSRKETEKEILQTVYNICKERKTIQWDDLYFLVLKCDIEVEE